MEPLGAFLTGIYADILRHIPPQILQDLRGGHIAFTVEIGHLPPGMDTCIGAAAAADLNGFSQDSGQALLNLSLNGVILPRKTLPTLIPGAIIANFKPQIPHIPSVPLWLPAGNLPKTGSFLGNHKPECVLVHNASDT